MTMRDRGFGVKTRMQNSRFQVHTPYSPKFVLRAHFLGGKWRKRSQMWSFPRHQYPEIAKALNDIFGTQLQYQGSDDD